MHHPFAFLFIIAGIMGILKYLGKFLGLLFRYTESNNTKEEAKMMLIVLFVAMLLAMFALEGQSEKRRGRGG